MNIALPLSEMTRVDKVRTMELLWDDLCRGSDELTSPAWHGDILQERDNRLAEGTEMVHDWEKAKERIRRAI